MVTQSNERGSLNIHTNKKEEEEEKEGKKETKERRKEGGGVGGGEQKEEVRVRTVLLKRVTCLPQATGKKAGSVGFEQMFVHVASEHCGHELATVIQPLTQ